VIDNLCVDRVVASVDRFVEEVVAHESDVNVRMVHLIVRSDVSVNASPDNIGLVVSLLKQ
jgi:hypothetical protein